MTTRLNESEISTTGNIIGNVIQTNNYQYANGAPFGGYGNSNVATFMANYGSNTVSTTGNITSSYFVGNGSQLTGIVAVSSYGNSNVATLLANFGSNAISTTGNVTTGNILPGGYVSAVGNVTGAYIFGNGSQLTGIVSSYGDANVVANLAALGSNPISATGNISAGNLIATGNIVLTGSLIGSGASPAPSLSGFSSVNAVTLSATGNVNATFGVNTGTFVLGSSDVLNIGTTAANSTIRIGNSTPVAILIGANTTNTVIDIGNTTSNVVIPGLVNANIISATGNVSGNNISATTAFQLPVYANTTVRDAAISSPAIGMLIVVGNIYQGYNGSAWGNIALT